MPLVKRRVSSPICPKRIPIQVKNPKSPILPRSGPKNGQSTSSYLASRTRDDIKWGQISPQAGYDARTGRKLGRVQGGKLKMLKPLEGLEFDPRTHRYKYNGRWLHTSPTGVLSIDLDRAAQTTHRGDTS